MSDYTAAQIGGRGGATQDHLISCINENNKNKCNLSLYNVVNKGNRGFKMMTVHAHTVLRRHLISQCKKHLKMKYLFEY